MTDLDAYVEKHWPGLLAGSGFSAVEWVRLSGEAKAAYLAGERASPTPEGTRREGGGGIAVVWVALIIVAVLVGGVTAAVLLLLAWLVWRLARRCMR